MAQAPKLVGIPLQFHFLEPNISSPRFSACGGDQKKAPSGGFSAGSPAFEAEKGPEKSAPNPGYQWYARKSGKNPAQ